MKKRILHFQLLPLLSGVQNVMLHILEGLNPEEYEVYVASQPGGPLAEACRQRGYRHLGLRWLKHAISPLDIVVFIQFWMLCRRYRFDLVHTHSSKPGFIGRLAARLAGVPLVLHTCHGAPFHVGQPKALYMLYILLEKLAARYCNRLIFVSDYLRLYYIEHGLAKAEQTQTIRNALSEPLRQQLAAVADRRQPPDKSVTIGSLLRFTDAKNIVQTLQAAIRVCALKRDVQFIFVGEGEHLPLCRQMVLTHQLEDRILLPGWADDIASWLSRFDAFLLYSSWEGNPLSIVEAMQAGLPVITSDIPVLAEVVDESCGWLLHAGSVAALTAGLQQVLQEKQLFRNKGKHSRQKAEQLFSYQTFLQSYLDCYRQVGR